ncbi:MAG: hypothetical protein Q4F84_07745, partial [Fibrobacter sp.]|nr:hypothetical protein [Fibrobacter sp.]
MVAVLVPKESDLPKLKEVTHAAQYGSEKLKELVNNILTAQPKCGLTGIPMTVLNKFHGEKWLSCVETLLDLIVRLLPMNNNVTTELNVYLEQRSEITSQYNVILEKICEHVLHRLSRVFPERAQKIKIKSKITYKSGCEYNGYADAAAYCLHKPELLEETGWKNTCLLTCFPDGLRRIIDLIQSEGFIGPQQWTKLLALPEAGPMSIAAALLRNQGEHVRNNTAHWLEYMYYTVQYMDSNAFQLDHPANQINWLKTWEPNEQELLPSLRLLWLTCQLHKDNHEGKRQAEKFQIEFENLCDQLLEEDAQPVCNSILHYAVSFSNGFDFDKFRTKLDQCVNICRKHFNVEATRANPENFKCWQYHIFRVIYGRRLFGRIISGYGQYEAFAGNNTQVIVYFREAINEFEKLTDPQRAKAEIFQIETYLIIAMMDLQHIDRNEFKQQLEHYLRAPVPDAIERLSVSNNPAEKYRHYILLRYLNSQYAAQEEQNVYIKNRAGWKSAAGHPGELIEFYRGLLLDDSAERIKQFRKAADLVDSKKDGITLLAIKAVILGALLAEDDNVTDEYNKLVRRLATE